MREHSRFDFSPIVDRKPWRLPNGARVAVWVIPNIEHFLFDRPSTSVTAATVNLVPDVLNYSWRDYGNRAGVWRLMEVMEKNGVKLLIDPMSYQYLVGAEIDYSEGLEGAQFVIKNPNAQSTCGCGSSFST